LFKAGGFLKGSPGLPHSRLARFPGAFSKHETQQVSSQACCHQAVFRTGNAADLDQGPTRSVPDMQTGTSGGNGLPESSPAVRPPAIRPPAIYPSAIRPRSFKGGNQGSSQSRIPGDTLANQNAFVAKTAGIGCGPGSMDAGLVYSLPRQESTETSRNQRVDSERSQIPGIDAVQDTLVRSKRDQLLEVIPVAHLYERSQPIGQTGVNQNAQGLPVQNPGNKKQGIGTGAVGDFNLLWGGNEVLA